MAETGEGRSRIELVRINRAELARKLRMRGKPPSALRVVVSGDTLAKIARGDLVSVRMLEKITAQLAEWPELEHGADLLAVEG